MAFASQVFADCATWVTENKRLLWAFLTASVTAGTSYVSSVANIRCKQNAWNVWQQTERQCQKARLKGRRLKLAFW